MNNEPVLLVEDDPADARLIQRAFAKLATAPAMIRLTNGDDVVSYLAGEPPYENRTSYPLPCVILLDIKLPRRSGFEVLQWVRRQPTALNRLPVIMLTSSRHSVDINRAYDLGANSYLTKPESGSQLDELATRFQSYWLGLNESPDLHGGVATIKREK
ncbi:MAG TPA: response regulator [Terriglobales bacterium]|nr:response regulator [Terriglobales bacterium]HXF14878.1 response regulator [Terriglobales bacterium]